MKVCGIVCEYNPFHNGHIHHINECKKRFHPDILICVMSSNFVQRGEPAIIDKWERAKIAVEYGVDLVIELPFIYSTQSANQFAQASIKILSLVGVDFIVFGSESNNLEALKFFSSIDDSNFKDYMNQGISSNRAYEQIYGKLNANDILGINYIKECKKYTIEPYCIARTNNYHEESLNQKFSSATSIRLAIANHENIQNETPMKNIGKTFIMKNYYPLIKSLLLTLNKNYLSQLFLMDEGIENNLIKNCKIAKNYEEFLSLCISKRYTKARIQRTLIHLINQTLKKDVIDYQTLNHIRILAYNEIGKNYLHTIKKDDLIIASKFNQIPKPFREMELKASTIYSYPLSIDLQNEWIKKELQPPIFKK